VKTRELVFLPVQSRAKRDRLSRTVHAEFIRIGTGGSLVYWYDDVEEMFYREYTHNGGPSSWETARLPGAGV
jgi:hypothetical protein